MYEYVVIYTAHHSCTVW